MAAEAPAILINLEETAIMNEEIKDTEEMKETGCEQTAPENASPAEDEKGKSKREEKKEEKKFKKECAELTEKCEKLEKENKELSDKYLRIVAEYDNFRKRSQKEKESTYSDAYADALKDILPVADNLERAVQFSESDKVIEGVKMTLNQLSSALEKMGVTVIETDTFDPNLHNAVMHVEDESKGENEIVEVFQKGYRRGDRVIRFAMVKVAN